MIGSVITWSTRNSFLVLLATAFIIFAGVYAVQRTALARGPEPCGDGNLTAVFSSGSILIMARPAV